MEQNSTTKSKRKLELEQQKLSAGNLEYYSTIRWSGDEPSLPPEHVQGLSTSQQSRGDGWTIPTRHIFLFLGFCSLFTLSSLKVNISIGIVSMVNWTAVQNDTTSSPHICHYNEIPTTIHEDGIFVWDANTQGYILASYFAGYFLGQLPAVKLAEITSPKMVLLTGMFISTLSTIFSPLAARAGVDCIVIMQVIKGMGQACVLPCITVMVSKWAPVHQRARWMTIMGSGKPLGAFFTLITSGIISKFFGWQHIFSIFGVLAAILCVFWSMMIYDSPIEHPFITRSELDRLVMTASQTAPPINIGVPMKAILTSVPVWAYILIGFAYSWILNLYGTVIPTFMKDSLRYGIIKNGIMSSIPNFAQVCFMMIDKISVDYVLDNNLVRNAIARKMVICTGLFVFSCCMLLLGLAGCNRAVNVFLLSIALGFSGMSGSLAAIALKLSPRFAETLMGIMNTFGALTGIIIPYLVGYFTKYKQTTQQWQFVFYISSGVCIFAIIIFLIFGSTDEQPWNSPPVTECLSNAPEENLVDR